MKFQVTDCFRADRKRLSSGERLLVERALRLFVAAYERLALDPSASWPAALRVKDVEGAPGVWEMTWSFAGPDGRATFEWIRIDGEPGIRWRRIGRHSIFGDP